MLITVPPFRATSGIPALLQCGGVPSTPIKTSVPTRNGSVFDALSLTLKTFGSSKQSTDTSLNVRCDPSWKNCSVVRVISPEQKKPKKKGYCWTEDDICPVAAVLAYMAMKCRGPGPFFLFQDGTPLTRARLVVEVKQALTTAGVEACHYSGHSFRSGAATTAAKQGP